MQLCICVELQKLITCIYLYKGLKLSEVNVYVNVPLFQPGGKNNDRLLLQGLNQPDLNIWVRITCPMELVSVLKMLNMPLTIVDSK